MDKRKDGRIEGYLDLEITSINVFTDDFADSTETLVINVEKAIDAIGRLIKTECEDDLDPQLEEPSKP